MNRAMIRRLALHIHAEKHVEVVAEHDYKGPTNINGVY